MAELREGEDLVVAESPAIVQPQPPDAAAPVEKTERITALDCMRGFALLGILLMNIIGMSMTFAAYNNPTITGGPPTGANLWVWIVLHVLAEGKMRCLFSLVFGAGVILLTSRLEAAGKPSADIYYRRTLWLLLFGIVHAFLLWGGDILYPYALCGLILFPFRHMSAKGLAIIGSVFLVIISASYIGLGYKHKETIEKGRAAQAAKDKGEKLSKEQEESLKEYEGWRKVAQPTAEELKKNDEEWRGNPLQVIKARAGGVLMFHSKPYYHPMNYDIWSMMFLGMALMKSGILSGSKSYRFYTVLLIIGYGIGLTANSFSAWRIVQSHFDPVTQAFSSVTYDTGRLSIALGHLAAIMLLTKANALRWIMGPLGAVGQMAFSNYIMQSVITAFLFTGYGFKLYGTLQRYQVYYVVAAIWIFQLIVSPIWLKHFRFGPLEWAWRSLTYWKRQPMRIRYNH